MLDLSQRRLAKTPLLTLAACLALGIVSGHLLGRWSETLFVLDIFIFISASVLGFLYLRRRRLATASWFVAFSFFTAGLGLFLLEARPLGANRVSRMYEAGIINVSEPVEFTATIEGQPEPAPESFYLTLRAQRIRVKNNEYDAAGKILLVARLWDNQTKSEYEALKLRHGARIRVLTTLDREDNFRNPGVLPFTEYLERNGYDATGVIKSPLLIERLDDDRVFLPLAWLYDWRTVLQQKFYQLFSAETAGVLDATFLGNKHNISFNAAERFRDGGTFHVLVISGLQIAFIGGLALYAVRAFTKRRGLQSLCAGVFLWGYTIAVGADLSVVRSAFMFTIVVLAPVVSRRSSPLNNLGGAALALLIWRPNDLFDPSFQLTFLSVLSIVTIAVPILARMREVGSWRPTHGTPYPPQASLWFRNLSEALFWSERQWRTEMAGSNISYRLFKTPWAARLERWRLQTILRFAIGSVVVSAGVQIGLLPVLILYFHRVSLASLLLNIVIELLMALLALLSLAGTLISVLSYRLAMPLASLAEKMNWLMIHLVDPFSRLGIASFRMPHYRGWAAAVYALYFVLLGFLVLALRRWQPLRLNSAANEQGKVFKQRNVTTVSVCFLAVLVLVVHPVSGSRADGELHVDFLDVGQGDAALVTMPDGTTLMIDGGGRPNTDWNKSDLNELEEPFQRDSRSVGERVVSEYLWAKGLDRVDYILATHADADHIDGLNDVARNFKVRAAIVARTPAGDPGYRRFAETMQQAGVPVQRIGAGDVLRFGDVSAQVLWPPPRNDFTAGSRNNDSVVLRVGYREKTFLFTGDVENEAEHEMISAGVDLTAQIVKVAHHGSRTSSTEPFVTATKPAVAIVSVGRTSIFGHPNKEVVERWRAGGAQVLTTGESGTISVVTDGRQLKLSTFVPR